MKKNSLFKINILFLFILMSVLTSTLFANPAVWHIIPNESYLKFTVIENDAPVTGEFKQFTGDIDFDPNALTNSHVNIMVNIDSVSNSYADFVTAVKSKDWLNVAVFPKATFKSNHFEKISDNTYEVQGTLTIRDKSVPTSLTFHVEEYTQNNAKIKGSTLIKRNAFGVGQGDWSSTDSVKDEVKIDFMITAKK